MSESLYRELQQYLDTMSLGFPPTKSGIELKILQKLFSPEDGRLFLSMTQKLETPEELAARLGRDASELAAQLKDMRDRGLLFSMQKGDVTRYSTTQFVHGIAEFQINRLSREFAQMFEEYYNESFARNILFSTPSFMRTIPVQESLDTKLNVATFNDAVQIMRSQKIIAVGECFCRKEQDSLGKGCSNPKETCFMFGSMAKFYIDNALGRQIDADEAVRIVTQAQKAGMVTQPAAAQNPAALCSCCSDCCIVLRALKLSDKPAEHVTSNYQSSINASLCIGCEACLDICPMNAIIMKGDIAVVNLDRCIGCGLCVSECTSVAIRLFPKENQPYIAPGLMEQMQQMAKARGL